MNEITIPHRTLVRILLACFIVDGLLFLVLALGGNFELDGALGEAQALLDNREIGTGELAWTLFVLVSLLAGAVGLWFEKGWGRTTYTIAILMALLFIDPVVMHPIESLMDTTLTLMNGALLAVIWLHPACPINRDACEAR